MNQRPVKASVASMVPGLVLMAFGGLIIWKPVLIKYVFGGFLIVMGLGVTVAARKMSRTRSRLHNLQDQFQQVQGGFGGFPPGPPDPPDV